MGMRTTRAGLRRRRSTRVTALLALVLAPVLLGLTLNALPLAQVQGSDAGGRELASTGESQPARDAEGDELLAAVLASRSAERAAMTAGVPGGESGSAAGGRPGDVRVTPKGTRVWTASAMSDRGVPAAAVRAYRRAAARVAGVDPGCGLGWTLLAGVGRVESDHGRYDGARLGMNGVSRPRIIGLRLDGRGPVAAIRDTDGGRLDGDAVWDRAVGPMQFIPATWALFARDGDGDGRKNPHDLDDAAAAAAAYLCSGPGSLASPQSQAAAIFAYNQDDYYVALVQAFERGYRTGVFVMPPPPDDEADAEERRRRQVLRAERAAERVHARERTRRDRERSRETRQAAAAGSSGTTPSSKTSSGTTAKPAPAKPAPAKPAPAPAPKPSPAPSPTPQPATPSSVSALLTECSGGYCLGGTRLDLGVAGNASGQAAGDLAGNGVTGTNGEELTGLLGEKVTMLVLAKDGLLAVLAVNGIALV